MKLQGTSAKPCAWDKILIAIAAAEFIILFISGVSFSGLAGASFFEFGVDIFFGLVFAIGAPQFIVQHFWVGVLLDAAILILMMLLYRNPKQNKVAIALFVLTILFYVTLMGYLTHRNFHAGMFLVWIPFLFRNGVSRSLAWEATRYYILFFYFSAGLLKLLHHAIYNVNALSNNLVNQFKPYYIEGNTGIRTQVNLYLIDHPVIGYALLVVATAVELICIVGFFTKKFDAALVFLLLLFHLVNWFIMDLSVIGQIAFLCLLFAGSAFYTNQRSLKQQPGSTISP